MIFQEPNEHLHISLLYLLLSDITPDRLEPVLPNAPVHQVEPLCLHNLHRRLTRLYDSRAQYLKGSVSKQQIAADRPLLQSAYFQNGFLVMLVVGARVKQGFLAFLQFLHCAVVLFLDFLALEQIRY